MWVLVSVDQFKAQQMKTQAEKCCIVPLKEQKAVVPAEGLVYCFYSRVWMLQLLLQQSEQARNERESERDADCGCF